MDRWYCCCYCQI